MKKDESAVADKTGLPTAVGIIIRVLLSSLVVVLLFAFIAVVFDINYDEVSQSLVDLMKNAR